MDIMKSIKLCVLILVLIISGCEGKPKDSVYHAKEIDSLNFLIKNSDIIVLAKISEGMPPTNKPAIEFKRKEIKEGIEQQAFSGTRKKPRASHTAGKCMADTYHNFKELAAVEKENRDFRIFAEDAKSRIAIVAPHGGGIEPGTSEIARSISNGKYNCYCFEGIKSGRNKELLHITSTNFDEPKGIKMCQSSETVVSIHGADDEEDIVFVGGLDKELKNEMIRKLTKEGFNAKEDITGHSGQAIENLCNKGTTGKGLQLEISNGLRKKMFEGLTRKERNFTTEKYDKFIEAVQCVLGNVETR